MENDDSSIIETIQDFAKRVSYDAWYNSGHPMGKRDVIFTDSSGIEYTYVFSKWENISLTMIGSSDYIEIECLRYDDSLLRIFVPVYKEINITNQFVVYVRIPNIHRTIVDEFENSSVFINYDFDTEVVTCTFNDKYVLSGAFNRKALPPNRPTFKLIRFECNPDKPCIAYVRITYNNNVSLIVSGEI